MAILFALAFSSASGARDNDGCTDATLKGDGFTIAGQTLNTNGTTSVFNGVALTHFAGPGHFT